MVTMNSLPSSAGLAVYWQLASTSAEERTTAVQTLVSMIAKEQQVYTIKQSTPPTDDTDDLIDDSNPTTKQSTTEACPALQYALKRLLRGLQSSRLSARQGFANALVQIFHAFPSTLSAHTILTTADTVMVPQSQSNRQESKDYRIAQLFLYLVLSHPSLTLLSQCPLPELTKRLTTVQHEINDDLALRQLWYHTLLQVCKSVGGKRFMNSELEIWVTSEVLPATIEAADADQLAFILQLIEVYTTNSANKLRSLPGLLQYVHTIVQSTDVIEYEPLNKILLASITGRTRTLHSAMLLLVQHMHCARAIWWQAFVNTKLLSGTDYSHRDTTASTAPTQSTIYRYIALLLTLHLLRHSEQYITADTNGQQLVTAMFSTSMVKLILDNMSHNRATFNKLCTVVLTQLLDVCTTYPSLRATIVLPLVTQFTSMPKRNFDHATKTNTVKTLISMLDASSTQQYVERLVQQLQRTLKAQTSEQETAKGSTNSKNSQLYAIDHIYSICKQPSVIQTTSLTDSTWLHAVIELFIQCAYFTNARVDRQVADVCRARLQSLINVWVRPVPRTYKPGQKADDDDSDAEEEVETKQGQTTTATPTQWMQHIVNTTQQLIKQDHKPLVELDEDTLEVRSQTLKMVKTCDKHIAASTDEQLQDKLNAIKLLTYSLLNQQMASAADVDQINDQLAEVNVIAIKIQESAKPAKDKRKSKKPKASAEDDEPSYMQVLTDLLLSLLSTPSDYYRFICKHMMSAFADVWTIQCTEAVMEVLLRKLNQPDVQEVSEDDEDDDAIAADNAARGVEAESSDSESDEEEVISFPTMTYAQSQSNESDNDLTLNMDEVTDVLLEDLQKEDTYAPDDYNNALANIVQLKKKQQTAQKDLLEQLVHFKLRTIDMLDSGVLRSRYVSGEVVLHLITRLLDVIQTLKRDGRADKSLLKKLAQMYSTRVVKSKHSLQVVADSKEAIAQPHSIAAAQAQETMQLLVVHLKRSDPDTLSLAGQGLMYLTRVWLALDESAPITQYYIELLQHYLTVHNSHLSSALFTEVLQRFPTTVGWKLADTLLQYAALPPSTSDSDKDKSRCATIFLHSECFVLLQTLMQYKAALKDDLGVTLTALATPVAKAITVTMLDASQRLNTKQADADDGAEEKSDNKKDNKDSSAAKHIARRLNQALRFVNTYALTLQRSASARPLKAAFEKHDFNGISQALPAELSTTNNQQLLTSILSTFSNKPVNQQRPQKRQREENGVAAHAAVATKQAETSNASTSVSGGSEAVKSEATPAAADRSFKSRALSASKLAAIKAAQAAAGLRKDIDGAAEPPTKKQKASDVVIASAT